jgi:uncharacterized protein (TIGR00369 family)
MTAGAPAAPPRATSLSVARRRPPTVPQPPQVREPGQRTPSRRAVPTFDMIMFEVIRLQLARSVPFARLLGISVDALDAGSASTALPPQLQHNNHEGAVHAGALFTLCETASGAALAGALLPVIMQTRFVVRDAHISCLKPARGSLQAQVALADEAGQVIDRLLAAGRAEVSVDIAAHAADGTLVAKATFDWSLRLIAGSQAATALAGAAKDAARTPAA